MSIIRVSFYKSKRLEKEGYSHSVPTKKLGLGGGKALKLVKPLCTSLVRTDVP